MTRTEALTSHWDKKCVCGDRVLVHTDGGCSRRACSCSRGPVAAAQTARMGHARAATGYTRLLAERRRARPAKRARSGFMRSMTFGVMPPMIEWNRAFAREAGASYPMTIRGSADARAAGFEGYRSFNASELRAFVRRLLAKWNRGNEDAGSLASGIMGTLGFEWL